jgi:hypothetical protein
LWDAGIRKDISPYVLRGTQFFKEERRWFPVYFILTMYFMLLLAFMLLL